MHSLFFLSTLSMHQGSQNSNSELQIVYKQMRNWSLPGSHLSVVVLPRSFQLPLRKPEAVKAEGKKSS